MTASNPEPRHYFLTRSAAVPSQPVTLAQLGLPGDNPGDPALAVEIAPGVRAAYWMTGGVPLPDGNYGEGALITVWDGSAA